MGKRKDERRRLLLDLFLNLNSVFLVTDPWHYIHFLISLIHWHLTCFLSGRHRYKEYYWKRVEELQKSGGLVSAITPTQFPLLIEKENWTFFKSLLFPIRLIVWLFWLLLSIPFIIIKICKHYIKKLNSIIEKNKEVAQIRIVRRIKGALTFQCPSNWRVTLNYDGSYSIFPSGKGGIRISINYYYDQVPESLANYIKDLFNHGRGKQIFEINQRQYLHVIEYDSNYHMGVRVTIDNYYAFVENGMLVCQYHGPNYFELLPELNREYEELDKKAKNDFFDILGNLKFGGRFS